MPPTFMEIVERKLNVAIALNAGQCNGSYQEATLLLSGIVSGLAADIWCGKGIDRRRFVEIWVQYADASLNPARISIPLLVGDLDRRRRTPEAEALRKSRPVAYAPG